MGLEAARFELLKLSSLAALAGISQPVGRVDRIHEHTAAICSTTSFRRIELEARTDDVRASLCICVLRLACVRNSELSGSPAIG